MFLGLAEINKYEIVWSSDLCKVAITSAGGRDEKGVIRLFPSLFDVCEPNLDDISQKWFTTDLPMAAPTEYYLSLCFPPSCESPNWQLEGWV